MRDPAPTLVLTRGGLGRSAGAQDADPITTEVIRHGLNSAANQMKRALVRTAFSPIVYEVLDFAAVLYDRDFRLLAQAPSLPFFMGTMSFCVEGAVAAVGGESGLEPGDAILVNDPYVTGSHPQDAAVVLPVFLDGGELVGFSAIKAHWLDIGALAPYCTDTTDVFQEGVIFPGVKLYARGELVADIWRMARANSRLPTFVEGDINAQVAGCRTGAAALLRLVERYGLERFRESVERMFDHGEVVVRSYLDGVPDGRYPAHGTMDSDGITDEEIPFDVVVEIDGSTARLDYSAAPDARPGPVNCPVASTVSASRLAVTMLAGGGEPPNEGHFRPIEVVTRPGSMFHCVSPSPCFLYGWPAMQAMEAALWAIGQAFPERVSAYSGGDICGIGWYGNRAASGEFWADGSPHPVGQGATATDDGASSLIHHIESATRFAPLEVWEARNPWLMERMELAPDSGGAGKHRGGLGADMFFTLLEDALGIVTLERTKTPPWGLAGGLPGRANAAALRRPDGRRQPLGKVTGLPIPAGATLELRCGGGGGWGPPAERDPAAVHEDVREGYVTEPAARRDYPHAF